MLTAYCELQWPCISSHIPGPSVFNVAQLPIRGFGNCRIVTHIITLTPQ